MSIRQTIKPGTRVRVLIRDGKERVAIFQEWTRSGNPVVRLVSDGSRVIVDQDAIMVIS